MSHRPSSLVATDIAAYLQQQEQKELLRVLICGSVDDGKSTLIGRLLHDSQLIYEDQLAAIHGDSRKFGTTGNEPDLALLVDGLQAEREQGITIDVAWRYFSTDKRKFIIADTPGHEQYTRNMATGAATCDLAIVLVDARNGIQVQTRRHTLIVRLLGIRHIVLAINKMDLVAYSEERFSAICQQFRQELQPHRNPQEKENGNEQTGEDMSAATDIDISYLPVSALKGDNIIHSATSMPWYSGETLMQRLENVAIEKDRNLRMLRFPVQWVNRPNLDFRGFSGTLAAGIMRPGDKVKLSPSGQVSRVKSIVTYDGELQEAYPPMAITLTLEDEIDISRGNVFIGADEDPEGSRLFHAYIVWMSETPLRPKQPYYIQCAGGATTGEVRHISMIDPNSGMAEPDAATALRKVHDGKAATDAATLPLNGIAVCQIHTESPLFLDSYTECREMGGFILIDRITNITVGAGMVLQAQSVSQTLLSQVNQRAKDMRPEAKHTGYVLAMSAGEDGKKIAEHMCAALNYCGGNGIILDYRSSMMDAVYPLLDANGIITQLTAQHLVCFLLVDTLDDRIRDYLADKQRGWAELPASDQSAAHYAQEILLEGVEADTPPLLELIDASNGFKQQVIEYFKQLLTL